MPRLLQLTSAVACCLVLAVLVYGIVADPVDTHPPTAPRHVEGTPQQATVTAPPERRPLPEGNTERADPSRGWVTGVVARAGTQDGVPGVKVTLRRGAASSTALAKTETDAAGRFRLPADTGELHYIEVEAAGFPTHWRAGVLAGRPVRVALRPAVRLRGRVIDHERRPVAGAEVFLDIGVRVQTRSAADGSFGFDGVAAGRATLRARRGMQESISATFDLAAAVPPLIVLRFWPTESLSGQVLDDRTGRPVAGAGIRFPWDGRPRTRTDADGRFTLRRPPLTPALHVEAPGFAWHMHPLAGEIEAPPTIRLLPAVELRGALLLPPGVQGRKLNVRVEGPGEMKPVSPSPYLDLRDEVDVPGGFAFRLEAGTDYRLTISGRGLATFVRDISIPHTARERYELPPLRLAPEAWIGGKVTEAPAAAAGRLEVAIDLLDAEGGSGLVDERGQPLPDSILHFAARAKVWPRIAPCDASGRFLFRGLAAGRYRLRCNGATEDLSVRDGEHRLDVALRPAAIAGIAGRVVDEGGQPLLDTPLHVWALANGAGQGSTLGAEGRFFVPTNGPGPYRVGGQFLLGRRYTLLSREHVRPGERDVELVALRNVPIEVRVLDSEGRGVEAEVTCSIEGIRVQARLRRTDAEGRLTLPLPPARTVRVSARRAVRDELQGGAGGVDPPAASVDYRAAQEGHLELRLEPPPRKK